SMILDNRLVDRSRSDGGRSSAIWWKGGDRSSIQADGIPTSRREKSHARPTRHATPCLIRSQRESFLLLPQGSRFGSDRPVTLRAAMPTRRSFEPFERDSSLRWRL